MNLFVGKGIDCFVGLMVEEPHRRIVSKGMLSYNCLDEISH